MNRIIVIGSPGAGKTVFAKKLARILQLPLIHLDQHSRIKNWEFLDRETWRKKVAELCTPLQWIIDGDYLNTLDIRAQKADTIIFLDLPSWLCVWRVFIRGIKNWRSVRSDMPENCREELSWKFLRFVKNTASYKKNRRPVILNSLKQNTREKKIIILTNKNEIGLFLSKLCEVQSDQVVGYRDEEQH